MDQLEQRAKDFATKAHAGQVRKYTGEPYINHPAAVVELVRSVYPYYEEMLAAAWLHDVVEDCGVTYEDLKTAGFRDDGSNWVIRLVYHLTDASKTSDGNRAARKNIDLEHLSTAPAEAKTIKLADIIDNTSSIVKYDPEFAKVYLKEKRALLEVLKEGDANLWKQAYEIVHFPDKLVECVSF